MLLLRLMLKKLLLRLLLLKILLRLLLLKMLLRLRLSRNKILLIKLLLLQDELLLLLQLLLQLLLLLLYFLLVILEGCPTFFLFQACESTLMLGEGGNGRVGEGEGVGRVDGVSGLMGGINNGS